MKFRNILIFLFSIILVGCASNSKKAAQKYRGLLVDGKFDEAKSMVNSGKLYEGDNSRLLQLVELAMVEHLQGHYYQSLKLFDQAQVLSEKLFTKSISKKAASYILNESVDNYYGEKYERSLIKYYQALNHYLIAKTGIYEAQEVVLNKSDKKDKANSDSKDHVKIIPEKKLSSDQIRRHLYAARASIVGWDSILDSYRKVSIGNDHYKDDMSAKIFGAWIHRSIQSRSDRTIAKGLYKEANTLLYRNYNTYPTYNDLFLKFREDFEKLPKMKKKDIDKNYIEASSFSKSLKVMIDDELKSLGSKAKRSNTFVLLNQGFIAQKLAKTYKLPIGFNTLPLGISAVHKGDFISFVRKILAVTSISNPAIEFELPYVEAYTKSTQRRLVVKDKNGAEVLVKELSLINPISDLAREALDHKNSYLKTKVGARLVSKHLVALASAYATYRTTRKKQGEFLAITIASGIYAVANKGIAFSEGADLRYWSSLPDNIFGCHLNLKPGQYQLVMRTKKNDSAVETKLGKLDVGKGKSNFFKKRIY